MAKTLKRGEWVRPNVVAQLMSSEDVDLNCCGRCYHVAVKAEDYAFPTAWKCIKHDVMTEADSSCVDFAPNPNLF